MKGLIITIDGPAASGKSTTARMVAENMGYLYLDTGAMYRGLTLKALEKGIDLRDKEAIAQLARDTKIELVKSNGIKTIIDGRDVTQQIRSRKVTAEVGVVSEHAMVRKIMQQKQREMGREGGIVAEGRDIGTVIFPNADLKIFMVASLEERAQRRYREYAAEGIKVDFQTLKEEIRTRDEQDSTRENSPLKRADDAVVLDTTGLSIEEQVEIVLEKIENLKYEGGH